MGSIPPQLLAALMQHAGGGGMGGGMTPGAAMMGGPQLGVPQPGGPQIGAPGMQHPQMPNQAPMMPPQQAQQQMPAQAGGTSDMNSMLLAALKGQQNGLNPQQSPHAMGASGYLPAWLQALLGGGAPMPQVPGAGPGGMMGGGV